MPQAKWFLAVAIAALAAALALGNLPFLEPRLLEIRGSAWAHAPHRPVFLSDDNLPDAVAGLRLGNRIARVGWDHAMLTMDVVIRDGSQDAAALWRDLAALYRFSFGETGNVRRLLLRVYAGDGDGRTLLLYGDPRREDWPESKLNALNPRTAEGGKATVERFRLSVTSEGSRWLRKF